MVSILYSFLVAHTSNADAFLSVSPQTCTSASSASNPRRSIVSPQIAGAKPNTVPQAGLYTTARVNPLAQEIVQAYIDKDFDPEVCTLYPPIGWRDENNEFFGPGRNWLLLTRNVSVDGRNDYFSPKIGNECYPDGMLDVPEEAVFDPRQVVIIGNGRCASACSIFAVRSVELSLTSTHHVHIIQLYMEKLQGSRTVVVGGRKSTPQ